MRKKGLLGGKYSKEEEEKREPLEENEVQEEAEGDVEPEKRKAPMNATPAKKFRKLGGMISLPGIGFMKLAEPDKN